MFQFGKCAKGNACMYAHVVDPNFKPKRRALCHAIARGRPCPRGDACPYSHDPVSTEDGNAAQTRRTSSNATDETTTRDLLMRWRFKIPRDARERQKTPTVNLAEFFGQALELVAAGAETMQQVINTLASDGGRFRMDQLLKDRDFASVDDGTLGIIWRSQLLPLLQILAHENVLASRVIEVTHGTLLNELYGTNGNRAVQVFTAVLRCLTMDAAVQPDDFETSLLVLAGVLVMNGSAHVNPGFQGVCETFVAIAESQTMSGLASSHLLKIQIRLGIGKDLPEASNSKTKLKAPLTMRPDFVVKQDLPGEMSDDGPRHDNDHADIRDIQILPTLQEIQSDRVEYLPRGNSEEWHTQGIAGLIDRHFRLVREDTVGQLRDVAKFEYEHLQNPMLVRQERRQGARTHTYRNVQLAHVHFDEQRGLQVALSFDQPPELRNMSATKRRTWWEDSMRLGSDALVCLLSSDGSATFLVVAMPALPVPLSTDANTQALPKPLHEGYSLSADPKTSHVIAHLADPEDDATELLARFGPGQDGIQRSLIEFPGVVLPAFEPTLKALQQMADTLDLPFANLLSQGGREPDVLPPAYARKEGFQTNLGSLTGDNSPLRLRQDQQFGADTLLQNSTLDVAQQRAIIHALTHQVALIQGPPGTGKSYSGIKIIQVLLDNKTAGKLGPIVCVCYTNHALDQLLEHLLDSGVTQVIRIGSRSKSEKLAQVNLRSVAMKHDLTKYEKEQRYKARCAIEAQAASIDGLLENLQKAGNYAHVERYLDRYHTTTHAQLFAKEDEHGWRRAGQGGSAGSLKDWLAGGARQHHTRVRSLGTLQSPDQDLFAMSHEERKMLLDYWVRDNAEGLRNELAIYLKAYGAEKERLDEIRGELDVRVLSEANVIGVTTSGLARNLKHLRKLKSKVLVVEEAGEVLEAHLLTAMLPSVEHAILIGDHQQLRPRVQNYDLSCENPRSQVGLDISLFERLVQPRQGNGERALPFVTLETQRRMHPLISQLIRSTLYRNLQDAPSVAEYPEVSGMRHRLFWLDHKQKEDGKNEHMHTTSHINTFEVQMVTSLVSHLVRQGVYRAEDIAVLTPYLGQLRKLRTALSGVVEVVLNGRDVDDLAREGVDEASTANNNLPNGTVLQAAEAPTDSLAPRNKITRGNLLQALRLATVDNFQGEEAKVVVVSLVRSNDQRKCGFLRTSNRINVLLSRAQHGMYVIGNSATSAHIPMWREVLQMMSEHGNLGVSLALCCPRHPEILLEVSEPDHFKTNCGTEGVKDLRADMLEMKTYREVDLDETPCIFTQCGHVFTVETLDGLMSIADHYTVDANGVPLAVKGNSEPFSYEELKACPDCRGSLRNIARYGRIVRRALLDEATKKFISWSNRAYVPLAERLQKEQGGLLTSADRLQFARGNIVLERGRGVQMEIINELKSTNGRYKPLLKLRKDVRDFMQKVSKEEQPFQRVRDMVETVRRRAVFDADTPTFDFDQTILQTRGHLLATALLIRCDLIGISDLVSAWERLPPTPNKPGLKVNFSANRIDCGLLTEQAEKSMNRLQQVESHVFWAQFAALELSVMYGPADGRQDMVRTMDELRRVAHTRLDMAKDLCRQYPGQTANVVQEADEVRRMLDESTTNSEMRMVVAAMATEFSGTGHWYRCVNGHPFTIGECGMPMQTARCPQCDARIGGEHHQAEDGVTHAGDIERDFGGLHL
ncbi:hypothetical protein LTR65_005097 [Meristemomyces frigidus]